MKLPNGYGTVYKLSGRRRKPWVARKTKGWTLDGEKAKQEYITIGYYATRTEALNALANYNQNPYDIDKSTITFAEVYEKWSEHHFKNIAASTSAQWECAYKYCKPLYNMRFCDIRVNHLEGVLADAGVGVPTKKNIKMLFGQLYKYAIKYEITDKNYAILCDNIKNEVHESIHTSYTNDEIALLWNNLNFPYIDMVLIGIYSGWRPQELCLIKTSDVDLEAGTMTGGIKTAAGKNRIVPIHSKIKPLLEARYNLGNEYIFTDKFNNGLSVRQYRYLFNKINSAFNLNHKPHDTRHTFVTLGKRYGMDEYILKLIVGHTVSDITEKVYTHRAIEELITEINKIEI